MKKLTFKLLTVAFLVFINLNVLALDEYQKKTHFNWTPDKVNSLSITNKFGNIHISNEVQDSVIVIATVTIE